MQPITVSVHFNSQPHKEADGLMTGTLGERRLTLETLACPCGYPFQLTASQGGWRSVVGQKVNMTSFQLTASQGGWHISPIKPIWRSYFNSQPHKEADVLSIILGLRSMLNFNSQPHKEADVQSSHVYSELIIFQLTASQGGWLTGSLHLNRLYIFQLTASQGGWQFVYGISIWGNGFQLTASQGGWPYCWLPCLYGFLFQLTASQGGWRNHMM